MNKTTLTSYTYSRANNRISKNVHVSVGGSIVSDDTETFIYGSNLNGKNSNQLHYHHEGGVVSIYNYDANGNRNERWVGSLLKGDYKWDARNRLVSITQDSPYKTHLYDYDYRARRIVRDEAGAGGEQTIISFSGGTSVFEKVGVATRVEYIRGSDYGGGIGGVMYSIRSGEPSFNAYNGRGDVVAKTNVTGTVTWQASYEAFGTRTAEHGINLDRQKANTKEEDPTGLLNEGFRYRDLVTGSFISRDPLGFVDGPNVYTYVRQNPWTFFDPLELNAFLIGSYIRDPETFEEREKRRSQAMKQTASVVVPVAASFVPGVGEAMDAAVIADPAATNLEKASASVSLGLNGITGGALPNAGGFITWGKEIVEQVGKHADEIVITARETVEKTTQEVAEQGGKTAAKKAQQRGRDMEAKVLEDMGLDKNTRKVSGAEGNSVPDFDTPTAMGDIENTRRVTDSKQLRIQREAAQQEGKAHQVVTGTDTPVSRTVQRKSEVIRRDDLDVND